tara:strand:+ start:358 stop:717 length:360 start_codon:yes stop_codon:yes gene_type:complete
MASNLKKYTVQEALNAALNNDGDALKFDIANVNLDGSQLQVDLDHANDSVHCYGADSNGVVRSLSLHTDGALILKADTDIASIKTDIAAMKADIAAIKATTDKLDACINNSDQLEVKTN